MLWIFNVLVVTHLYKGGESVAQVASASNARDVVLATACAHELPHYSLNVGLKSMLQQPLSGLIMLIVSLESDLITNRMFLLHWLICSHYQLS